MEATHSLKQFMDGRGWKQAEMAKFLDVPPGTLSRWLSGKRQIEPTKLREISERTGIPVRDLRPDLAQLLGDAA